MDNLTVFNLGRVSKADELLEWVVKLESFEEVVEEKSVRNFSLFPEFTSLIVIIFRQDLAIHTFMYIILRINLVTQAKQSLNSTENVDSYAIGIHIFIEGIDEVNDIIREDFAWLKEHLESFSEEVWLDILVDHLNVC